MITLVKPQWVEDLTQSYEGDTELTDIIAATLLQAAGENYSMKEGILRYKGRLVVGKAHDVRVKVMQAIHGSAI